LPSFGGPFVVFLSSDGDVGIFWLHGCIIIILMIDELLQYVKLAAFIIDLT
jgi:hypothetical protein